MGDAELADLERMCAAATPIAAGDSGGLHANHDRREKILAMFESGMRLREIAKSLGFTQERTRQVYFRAIEESKRVAFYSAARTALPALIAEVRRLRETVQALRDEIDNPPPKYMPFGDHKVS